MPAGRSHVGGAPGARRARSVEISTWSIGILAFVVLLNTVFIAGIAVFLYQLNGKLDEALSKATPLLDQAAHTLNQVEASTAQLQQRVDQVLEKTTTLVDRV